MLRFILFLIILNICVSINSNAQYNQKWVMGYNITGNINCCNSLFTMDFSNGQITYNTFPNVAYVMSSCDASICDSSGNLLFYTNGVAVMNALNDTMQNGTGLDPGAIFGGGGIVGQEYSQQAIIVPVPLQSHLYYLIHQGTYSRAGIPYGFCDTLYYSIVDMIQDSGRGAIIDKNHVLWYGDASVSVHNTIIYGGLTACKHANGRDWWIVTHKDVTNEFMSFLLTPYGFSGPYLQGIGLVASYSFTQTTFSPDGSKYAYNNNTDRVNVFDFDRCTGLFSNHLQFTNVNSPTYGSNGIAFSPNSQLLYASRDIKIYQWDLTAANVAASKKIVAVDDTFTCPNYQVYYFLMQLAADGKIYVSSPNSSYCMTVINNPDSIGNASNVINHGLSNLPYYNASSAPYFPNYNLGRLIGSACDTLTGFSEMEVNLSNIQITPNPNNGDFSISYSLPQNKSGWLEIFNSDGKIIYNLSLPPWSSLQHIDLPYYSSGIYMWKIKSDDMQKFGKLIIIK